MVSDIEAPRKIFDPTFAINERISILNATVDSLIELIGEASTVNLLKRSIVEIAAWSTPGQTHLQ